MKSLNDYILLQYVIESKIIKFIDNLTFEQYLFAIIGGCGVQAFFQYMFNVRPIWREEELEFINDPAFYLGIVVMLLMVIFVMRKSQYLRD